MSLEGFAHVFGDHINTDYIISGKHKAGFTDVKEMTKFLMEDIRPGFYDEIQPEILSWGILGCGLARGRSPCDQSRGIAAVLAKGLARIHFRNAINIGLPVLRVDASSIQEGDRLRSIWVVENLSRGWSDNASLPHLFNASWGRRDENYFKTIPPLMSEGTNHEKSLTLPEVEPSFQDSSHLPVVLASRL
jgi:3-isopropylmalate/(R)-2-methylmalate dehydratase small subunit